MFKLIVLSTLLAVVTSYEAISTINTNLEARNPVKVVHTGGWGDEEKGNGWDGRGWGWGGKGWGDQDWGRGGWRNGWGKGLEVRELGWDGLGDGGWGGKGVVVSGRGWKGNGNGKGWTVWNQDNKWDSRGNGWDNNGWGWQKRW